MRCEKPEGTQVGKQFGSRGAPVASSSCACSVSMQLLLVHALGRSSFCSAHTTPPSASGIPATASVVYVSLYAQAVRVPELAAHELSSVRWSLAALALGPARQALNGSASALHAQHTHVLKQCLCYICIRMQYSKIFLKIEHRRPGTPPLMWNWLRRARCAVCDSCSTCFCQHVASVCHAAQLPALALHSDMLPAQAPMLHVHAVPE